MDAFKSAIKNKWVIFSFILFGFTLFIFLAVPVSANEKYYGRYLYPPIRTLLNNLFGSLTIPGFMMVGPVLLLGLISILLYNLVKKKYMHTLVYSLAYFACILTLFFWVWGFFYKIPALIPQPDLNKIPIQEREILRTFDRALSIRNQIGPDSISPFWSPDIMQLVNDSGKIWLNESLHLLGKPTAIASKQLRYWPKGFILRWGIVGMYFPFTGESTLDRGIHAIRYPSTALHEWSHSMGFTHEGDCNLLAYIAAQFSDNTFIRYSAEIERLREELIFAAFQNPELFQRVKGKIPPIVEKDINDIRNYHARYIGVMSDMGNWLNDQYLKTLSDENGVDDYWLWIIKLHLLERENKLLRQLENK